MLIARLDAVAPAQMFGQRSWLVMHSMSSLLGIHMIQEQIL